MATTVLTQEVSNGVYRFTWSALASGQYGDEINPLYAGRMTFQVVTGTGGTTIVTGGSVTIEGTSHPTGDTNAFATMYEAYTVTGMVWVTGQDNRIRETTMLPQRIRPYVTGTGIVKTVIALYRIGALG